jgi:hypothetical protein
MSLDSIYLTGSSEKNREVEDFYPTPPYATLKLLEKETFSGSIYEPACGDGAISKILKDAYPNQKIYSTDLVDRGYGEKTDIDFLTYDFKNFKPINIITNPPYKLAQEFIEKSLELANSKVVMLLKLNFLEGQKRYNLFKSTPLRSVYIFSKRLSFDKGNEKGKGNGLLAYAWYVWEQGYDNVPMIDWLL